MEEGVFEWRLEGCIVYCMYCVLNLRSRDLSYYYFSYHPLLLSLALPCHLLLLLKIEKKITRETTLNR